MSGTDTAPGERLPLSILIVAYNSRGFIADCIGSVIAHTTPGTYEILLVDNGKDGTADLVATEFPEVRIIPGQGNIGFGRGNNLLAAHARGEYLLLLNPDTRLLDPAIDRLLAFARTRPGAAWGGVTTLPDGTLDGGNFLSLPTFRGVLRDIVGLSDAAMRRSRLAQLDRPEQVEVLSGGFMLVSRRAWDLLGGFDPSFLLYSEEVDLFARLKALGETAWRYHDSRIIHDIGGGETYSRSRMLYTHTGLMHYARRHWSAPLARMAGCAFWLIAARRWLVSAILSPTSARHRARLHAFTPILFAPRAWWRGYEGRTSLD